MSYSVPAGELEGRMRRFFTRMDTDHPGWDCAMVSSGVNLYYLTGTMPDGMLLIPRDGDPVLWVRRSYERARAESAFPSIEPMSGYRDAARGSPVRTGTVHLEAEQVSLAQYQRIQKHFPFTAFQSVDIQLSKLRAVKSAYELDRMEQAGRIHQRVLEDCVPDILAEGMSEAEFGSSVFSIMVRLGHQGIVRFGKPGVEIVVGQLGFGESSLYPTSFDGPGGCIGMGPAVPVLGSSRRKLAAGDLVFIDNACGIEGYQTDKTMTYLFGRAPLPEITRIHEHCVDIQDELASRLKPGAVPSELYESVMAGQDPAFLENFMGYGKRKARFLGHGVGLQVDEIPVITSGVDEPLEEGMTIALEPKAGVKGFGMVGIENTFVVTPGGGRSLTGRSRGLIPVL